jgi:hypothetical protein
MKLPQPKADAIRLSGEPVRVHLVPVGPTPEAAILVLHDNDGFMAGKWSLAELIELVRQRLAAEDD